MSEKKMEEWTPGKWQWYWRVEDGEANCGVFAMERPGMSVSVCRAPRYEKKSQWAANGRLIAAAPTLYAALEALCGHYPTMLPSVGLPVEAINKARAALKAARGEQ